MGLRLRQAIPGRPNPLCSHSVTSISLPDSPYFAYPSSSNVVIVSPKGELRHTLQFSKAIPHRLSTSTELDVQGVRSDTESGLLVAWSGIHVVFWQQSSSHGRPHWNILSTVVSSSPVTSLDYRKGLLALGTESGIEIWKCDPKASLIVWDRIWTRSCSSPQFIQLSMTCGHIAWFREEEKNVQIQALNPKGETVRLTQEIRLPRDVSWICWRASSSSSDPQLYVITINSVLRIYAPVLDDPTWFQLVFTMDRESFLRDQQPAFDVKGKTKASVPDLGTIWIPDAGAVKLAAKALVDDKKVGDSEVVKTLVSLIGDEMDLVFWFSSDGQMRVRSILNLDRKPPTLIKSTPIAALKTSLNPVPLFSPRSPILFEALDNTLHIALPSSSTMPVLGLSTINLPSLLSSTLPVFSLPDIDVGDETSPVLLSQRITRFVRSPNGRGLLAIGESGELAVWHKRQLGKSEPKSRQQRCLIGKGHWTVPDSPVQSAIYAKGRAIVSYIQEPEPMICLQHLDQNSLLPSSPIIMPHFHLGEGDKVEMLLAMSDIDDGYTHRGRKTRRALIMAATAMGEAWVWRIDSKDQVTPKDASATSFSTNNTGEPPHASLLSHHRLSIGHDENGIGMKNQPYTPLKLILPVDPMGWHQSAVDWETDTPLQDMILTVSHEGLLEFWRPKLGQHVAGHEEKARLISEDSVCNEESSKGVGGGGNGQAIEAAWTRTGLVHTGKTNIINARCSSRKKTVLVCELEDGSHEMTIWDSNVSEFSTGLELTHHFAKGETIQDLDWTTTSDLQSVLAVGFPHRIVLVCEQRMSYVDITPGWAPFLTIEMDQYTTVPISDSIWLAGGSLAVGCGNQVYVFSRFLDTKATAAVSATLNEAKEGEVTEEMTVDDEEPEDIFQLIAHQNGPLIDYHPTMLAQCLLWNKIDLVKSILLTLTKDLRKCEHDGRKRLVYTRLDPLDFHSDTTAHRTSKMNTRNYRGLFETVTSGGSEDEDELNSNLVQDLVERIDGTVAIPLSHSEKSALATIAQATLEIERQRRSLDICGLRYLISLRMFVNHDRRFGASGTTTPAVTSTSASGTLTPGGGAGVGGIHLHRDRLAFRNIVWATHSESQELLLQAATECCVNGKMLWEDAKRFGVFLWLQSSDAIKNQLEVIARNRFMADEDRDPTSCSLLFFALGKKKVVHGLWRQAPGHKEQGLMLKFLANDFDTDRWKIAAAKNAYALLSKQRYEYAAAFFMLAGNPKDAINVCLRQLNDWQLAVALARVVESGSSSGPGPILRWVIEETILPIAFSGGHRWLASWAFWTLRKRDLAVRVLISPMTEVAIAWTPEKPLSTGNPENDDPSLLLLFQHLKSKTLQTARGTAEIPEKLEFDFVLHNARVFFRMGCHPLGLDLLQSWSFDRQLFVPKKHAYSTRRISDASTTDQTLPSTPQPSTMSVRRPSLVESPTFSRNRRASFMLSNSHARHASVMIDVDLAEGVTEPPTRAPSPPTTSKSIGFSINSVGDLKINGNNGEGGELGDKVDNETKPTEEESNKPIEVHKQQQQPRRIGNLMKEMRSGIEQGGQEFDMSNFF